MNVELLDRTFITLDMFSQVSKVLGKNGARQWFKAPKETLNDLPPISLLKTRVVCVSCKICLLH